tara:strand:+ start:149 stop:346 length:198 start_codon:yes stop_codon:yes gene_type:complete
MATYVYVKRNRKRPYFYPDEDAPHIQFKLVSLGTAFNMAHSKQVGWERAKKGDYEHWLTLTKEKK